MSHPVVIQRCVVEFDLLAAIALVRDHHGVSPKGINDDEGLVISKALAAAFGGHDRLRPWRITRRNGSIVTIIGNGVLADLRTALDQASPASQAVIKDVRDAGALQIKAGRYRFEVRACPTRKGTKPNTDRCHEIDAFLFAVERKTDDIRLDRNRVYGEWLAQRLSGATLKSFQTDSFSIATLHRADSQQKWVQRRFPDATFTGILTVEDPEEFSGVLARGVGRQCAYGYGWVWLEEVK